MDSIFASPLAVNTSEMSVVAVSPLRFYNFDALPAKMTLFNSGLTVTLSGDWATGRRPSIEGSDLSETYLFSHLHFHWSNGDKIGSEHVINGQRYTMEMHVIFFKNSCKTVFAAESQKNGYLTLAYLFDITPDRHAGVEYITDYLNGVQMYGQKIDIPVFRLSYLMDQSPGEYFTYTGKSDKFQGTQTISKWIVFTRICKINSQQVERFRRLSDKRGRPIKRNCRTAVSAKRERDDDGTNFPCLVTGIFAGIDGEVRTDDKSKDVRDRSTIPRVLSTKTHQLRREFNREVIRSYRRRTSTNVADTAPRRTYSRNAATVATVHPKIEDRIGKVTTTPSLSPKPSWK